MCIEHYDAPNAASNDCHPQTGRPFAEIPLNSPAAIIHLDHRDAIGICDGNSGT
ncbi:MAG: hypothetical protein M3288_02520 [Thermoproteota archaeon]|nr:hypothetical protein [Thermoproteota archaeon]